MPRTPQQRKRAKMALVFRHAREGKLHTGSKTGPITHNPAQIKAIAIHMGEEAARQGGRKH